jgi:hypothetical protein
VKKAYFKVGFKSLTRLEEGTFILTRSCNLKEHTKFKHKGFTRILILIQGEKNERKILKPYK